METVLDIAKPRLYCVNACVVLSLPELENEGFRPKELRLELACALYARKRVSKVKAAALAGVVFFTFQHALKDRGIPQYIETMLEQDLQSLEDLK